MPASCRVKWRALRTRGIAFGVVTWLGSGLLAQGSTPSSREVITVGCAWPRVPSGAVNLPMSALR